MSWRHILNLSSGVEWSASHPRCCLHDTRPQYTLNWPHRSTTIFNIVPKSLVSGYHGNYILHSGANICESSLWNFLHVTFWHLVFWYASHIFGNFGHPLLYGYMGLEVHCSCTVGQTWQHRTVTAPYRVQHDTTANALTDDEIAH